MFFKAKIQKSRGNVQGAISTLENAVTNVEEYLAELHRADRTAGEGKDGFLIRSSLRRPESKAYFLLIDLYKQQNALGRMEEKIESLVRAYSPDGWNWAVNKRIGDVYERLGFHSKAREQYQLAQSGLADLKKVVEVRSKLVEGSEFPDNYWEPRQSELKMKIERLEKQEKK